MLLLFYPQKSHRRSSEVNAGDQGAKVRISEDNTKQINEVFAQIVEQSTLFWGIMHIKKKNSLNFWVV